MSVIREMGVDLPFVLKTGEMMQDVEKMALMDPTRIVEKYSRNLK